MDSCTLKICVAKMNGEIGITSAATPITAFQADNNNNYRTSTTLDNLINATQQIHGEHFVFHFGWLDYGLFVGLLTLSALIGIYYGFFSKHKQNNTSEYILGGRSMDILPVATSMIAT